MARIQRLVAVIVLLVYAVHAQKTITICETTGPGQLSCPLGKNIQITSSTYGRTKALPVKACNPYNTPISNFNCVGGAQSKNYVMSQCAGKTRCTLVNTWTILGDPCSGIPKFLKVDYQCVVPTPPPTTTTTAVVTTTTVPPTTTTTPVTQTTQKTTTVAVTAAQKTYKTTTLSPSTKQTTICEMKTATFTCVAGKQILITHVLWGRLPPSPANLCNPYNTVVTGANCKGGPQAALYVGGLCNGNPSCVVQNDWTKLGPDPCHGIPKYLQVSYQCVFPTSPTTKQTASMSTTTTAPTTTTSTPTTTLPTTTTQTTTPSTTTKPTPTPTTPTNKVTTPTTVATTLAPGMHSQLVCPPKDATIRCQPGFDILIDTVFYGRTSQVTCNPSNHRMTNLHCVGTKTSEQTVHNYCDHQSSCILHDTSVWLGEDPCPGVPKYLKVTFHCVPLVPPTTTPTTTSTTTTTPTTTSTTTTTPTTTSTTTTTPTTTSTTTTPTTTSTTTTTPTTTSTTTTTPTTTSTTTTPTTTSTTTTPTTTSTTTTTPTTTSTTTTPTTTTPTTTTSTSTSTSTTTPTTTSTSTTTASTPTSTTLSTASTSSTTTPPPTTMTTFPPYIPFRPPANAPQGAQVCHEYLVSGPHGVPDSHLTATSSWNSHLPHDNNQPERSRLFTTAYDYGNGTFYRGAWSAATNDKNQYIQVEFMRPSLVRGVVTQGRYINPLTLCCSQHVTQYKVQWSRDGITWDTVQDNNGKDMLFKGNSDADSLVTHMFDCPFIARFLRILPQDWFSHIALRFDAIGCQAMTTAIGQCDPGWLELPGTSHCYLFTNGSNSRTWNDAKRNCILQQGHLVDISSTKERDFVMQEINKRPGTSMWWVGLSNIPRKDNKDFKWTDGKDLDTKILQWKKGQPDNGGYGEHCAEFWNKELNDDNCNNKRHFICEKDKYWTPPVNTPTISIKTPPTVPPTPIRTTTATQSTQSTTTVTHKPPPTVFIPVPTMTGRPYVSTNGNLFSTGCISSISDCRGKREGDYQECKGCGHYATCAASGFWPRPCPTHLKWDDNTKTCEFRSSTCVGP